MKKTLSWLSGALVIGALSFFAFKAYYSGQKQTTLQGEASRFRIEDTAAVDSLHVYYRDGSRATLERVGQNWLLNKTYKASNTKVEELLGVLHNMRVKAPAPQSARENIIKRMASSSYKVKVWQGDTLVRNLYVGPDSPGYTGTYMRKEGSERIYETHIRGFNGYLSVYFQIDPAHFRSTEVFHTNPSYLQSFKLRYPKKAAQGFTIGYKNNYFTIEELKPGNLDTLRLLDYLRKLENVNLEKYVEKRAGAIRDSLLLKTPDCVLRLKDRRQSHDNQISIFRWPGHKDRMLGLMGPQKEPVVVQKYIFDKLLRSRQFFSKNRTQKPPNV